MRAAGGSCGAWLSFVSSTSMSRSDFEPASPRSNEDLSYPSHAMISTGDVE